METEFRAFPKVPRLFRDMTITEKIDGTNGCIIVREDGSVGAQSRTRLITPQDDNFGFAAWVEANATMLAGVLGPGHHFGEWHGRGIQRGYGFRGRYFALFNVGRFRKEGDDDATDKHILIPNEAMAVGLTVVPVLYEGPFSLAGVQAALRFLKHGGSALAFGQPAEGVMVYHHAAKSYFKVTLENDQQGKGQ